MPVRTIVTGSFKENCHLVWAEGHPQALCIDPGDDAPVLQAAVDELGLELAAILLTHCHLDHVAAVDEMHAWSGASVVAGQGEEQLLAWVPESYRFFGLPERPAPRVDHWLQPDSADLAAAVPALTLGTLQVRIYATPGHTPGGTSYRIGADFFSGDTLFRDSIGRTDLPGGNLDTLAQSLALMMALPADLAVHPGHGDSTTIGRERQRNPYIQQLVPKEVTPA